MLKKTNKYLSWMISVLLCLNNSFTVLQAEEEIVSEEEHEVQEVLEEETYEEEPEVQEVLEEEQKNETDEEEPTEVITDEVTDKENVLDDNHEDEQETETIEKETKDCNDDNESENVPDETEIELLEGTDYNTEDSTLELTDDSEENKTSLQNNEDDNETDVEGENKLEEAEIQASSNITYKISDGTLTISGTGYMEDYWSSTPEWKSYASQITKIVIKTGITYIGAHAFDGLTKATTVSLPSGLKSINAHAFNDCSSLKSVTIPNGVEFIGSYSFSGCKSLTSITIPSSVTMLGSLSFWNCESLTSAVLSSNITSLDYGMFFGDKNLTSITIPGKVKTIGAQVFANCSALRSVSIPNSVTSIGDGAFINCSSLTSVTLPNSITSMDINVFANCSKLASVTLPKFLTRIEKQLFSQCTSLRDITIPAAVNSIGEYAFSGCGISTITFSGVVSTIETGAFSGCSKLRTVYFGGTRNQWNRISIADYNDYLKNATIITNDVKAVIDAIDALGTVTLQKEQAIVTARSMYDSLASSEKTYVTNYAKLVSAEQTLSGLKVNNVISLINNIGEVSLGSQSVISAARTAYNKLTNDQKNLVTNYSVLTEAENCLSELQIQNVISLIDLIDSLEEVDLSDEETIKTARTAYNKLTASQKESITNYSDLVQAETALSGLQIQNVTSLINSLPETITLEDKTAVTEARVAYNKLSADQKKEVTNYNKLLNAETVIKKIETDIAAADAVIGKIDSLNKEVTIDDKTSIVAARAAYDKLTDDQKALVSNYEILLVAEETIAEIEDLIRWGEIAEEDKEQFESSFDIPEGLWVGGIPENITYDGAKKTFDIRVYDTNRLLKKKTDYSLTYKNNLKVGTASIVIKCNKKSNYKGTQTIYFTINPADLSEENPGVTVNALSAQATGKLLSPVPEVYFNGKKLKNNTDYTVSYRKYGNRYTAGEHIVTITGIGNFTGSRDVTVTVAPQSRTSVSKLTVKSKTLKYEDLKGDNFFSEIVPALTVKMGKQTVSSLGYTFEDVPEDYKKVGTLSFTLVGVEKYGYVGRKTVSVKISGISLTNKKVKANTALTYTYTGNEITIPSNTLLLTYDGTYLKEGIDFEIISYSNNINAGTATVTVKGINNYTGTKKVKYKILPITKYVSYSDVTIDKAVYCKGGAKPTVTVKDKTEGIDYTVKYSSNTKANTYGTALVTFIGNYKGTPAITKTFYINTKSLADTTITANDKMYSSSSYNYKSVPVLRDTDGKLLKVGVDYEKTYVYYKVLNGYVYELNSSSYVSPNTVLQVKVTGKGNYTGTITAKYRFVDNGKDISKATFKISPKEYTGSPVTLTAADIMSATIGKTTSLRYGTDYEVLSYSNNMKQGTAKVTFRGIGSYGGIKTVTFKIGKRSISDNWQGVKNFFANIF